MSQSDSPSSPIYHERQRLQLCALHSINNLFQEHRLTKSDLDAIVDKFDKSWCWNEYSTLFTGNYDLRILIEAFKNEGFELRAIDPNDSLENFRYNESFGLLLNKTLEKPFFERLPLINRLSKPARHWFAIKCLNDGKYYDLDSKLRQPKLIGDEQNLIDYLKNFDRKENYIYIVYEESKSDLFQR